MSSCQILIFFILISISASSTFTSKLVGVGVGGRTEIMNVESNREVHELSRFCVEQYNRKFRSGAAPLSFSGVVAGERQVVSGIKYYYLRIAVRDRSSESRMLFDAMVVVKPWAEEDRDLVSFAPAAEYWK